MKILIVGGSGFLGGRLAFHLANLRHEITLGVRKKITPPNPLAKYSQHEIQWEDSSALQHACMTFDAVVHAAGMNRRDCEAYPLRAIYFHAIATARLVEAAQRVNVKRFVYISTAHVYSQPLSGFITEETLPQNLHPYATSRLMGEYAVRCAAESGAIEGLVLRLANAYGAPVHGNSNSWELLINNLCRQAATSRKMIIYNDPHVQRDFISIRCVCDVIEKFTVMKGRFEREETLINVGTGIARSLIEIAKTIQERCMQVLGFKPQIFSRWEYNNILSEPLQYQINRLSKYVLVKDKLDLDEIDKLLLLCFETSEKSKVVRKN